MNSFLTAVTNQKWRKRQKDGNRDKSLDHFTSCDGEIFAGTHIILDFWEATNLDNLEIMEVALRECVEKCNATLLHIHLHRFTPNSGISGVAVLAESHISVHTWPEKNFGAFDIFMCGDANPHKAIKILDQYFCPSRYKITEQRRGRIL